MIYTNKVFSVYVKRKMQMSEVSKWVTSIFSAHVREKFFSGLRVKNALEAERKCGCKDTVLTRIGRAEGLSDSLH